MLRGASGSAWVLAQRGRRRPRSLSSCAGRRDSYHPPAWSSLRFRKPRSSWIPGQNSGSARGLSSFLEFMQERESPAAIPRSDKDERQKGGSARDQGSLLESVEEQNAQAALPQSIKDEQLAMGIVSGRPSFLEFMLERKSPSAMPLSYRDERANTRESAGLDKLAEEEAGSQQLRSEGHSVSALGDGSWLAFWESACARSAETEGAAGQSTSSNDNDRRAAKATTVSTVGEQEFGQSPEQAREVAQATVTVTGRESVQAREEASKTTEANDERKMAEEECSQALQQARQAAETAMASRFTEDDCLRALQEAREARARLGDVKVVAALYKGVLRIAFEVSMADLGLEVLKEMEDAGGELTPDSSRYTLMLDLLAKRTRDATDPEQLEALHTMLSELYRHMMEKGVTADTRVLFGIFDYLHQDRAFWMEGLHLFETLRSRVHEPGYDGENIKLHHYQAVVKGCLEGGMWTPTLIDKMKEDNVKPTPEFLVAIMKAALDMKEYKLALLWWKRFLLSESVSLASFPGACLAVQAVIAGERDLLRASRVVKRCEGIRGTYQGEDRLDTYALKCLVKITGVDARIMGRFMLFMYQDGVRLHPKTFTIAIKKAIKAGVLYSRALEQGFPPDYDLVHAAITGCSTLDKALAIANSMEVLQLQQTTDTYAALLHVCSRGQGGVGLLAGQAGEMWDEMKAKGLERDWRVLAPYLTCLMKDKQLEVALDVREKHRDDERESEIQEDTGLLESPAFTTVGRAGPVIDCIVCRGLLASERYDEVIEVVYKALHGMPKATDDKELLCLDDYNNILRAAIMACRKTGKWEIAVEFLGMVEERWETGPRVEGGYDGWLKIYEAARHSRRRIYDHLVTIMMEQNVPHEKTRYVLERGLRNASVSLLRDSGSIVPELALEFNGCWGTKSAITVLRCILEDILKDQDFLLNNGQYLLAVHVIDQLREEFGCVTTWFTDGDESELLLDGGLTPVRRGQYQAINKVRVREGAVPMEGVYPVVGGVSLNSEYDQQYWYRREKFTTTGFVRLTISTGADDSPGSVKDELLRFAEYGVEPRVRLTIDQHNPHKCLMLKAQDVRYWARNAHHAF